MFVLQVLDCAVCSFLLEKGVKPKGEDFTCMLASFALFSLNNAFVEHYECSLQGSFIF